MIAFIPPFFHCSGCSFQTQPEISESRIQTRTILSWPLHGWKILCCIFTLFWAQAFAMVSHGHIAMLIFLKLFFKLESLLSTSLTASQPKEYSNHRNTRCFLKPTQHNPKVTSINLHKPANSTKVPTSLDAVKGN